LLLESFCAIWSDTLTDLTIDMLHAKYGRVDDQIEALTWLSVIERLTLSNDTTPKDDDLMKVSIHPNLPTTLKNISWKWMTSKEPKRQRRDVRHHHVRQSFASRVITCHNIEILDFINTLEQ
jgi:hypothetical protein